MLPVLMGVFTACRGLGGQQRNSCGEPGNATLQGLRRDDKQKADSGRHCGHKKFFQIKITTSLKGSLFYMVFFAGASFDGF